MFEGIDTSEHNGTITAKDLAGVDFIIIRAGYGSDDKRQDDSQFNNTLQVCENAGKPWGVYLYSYALNTDDARSEAAHLLRLLHGRKPPMGAWIDMEDADGYKERHGMPDAATLSAIAAKFCEIVEGPAGYAGIYASRSWLEGPLNNWILDRYDKWVADWSDCCRYSGAHHLWQYTCCKIINGRRFDANRSDALPLNRATSRKDEQTLADEVIRGLWGNGEARKARLTAAGYNYEKIQALVNKKLSH